MPRPGFYNDNEYRAYPFVFKPGTPPIPESAIVDAGMIMHLPSNFDDAEHSIWLASVTRRGTIFEFEFATDAVAEKLLFLQAVNADSWQVLYADSEANPTVARPCPDIYAAAWEGFIVTGPMKELAAFIPADNTLFFEKNVLRLEPARIQNLNKAYVRSINVGNYERVTVSDCGQVSPDRPRDIVMNAACLHGDIRFKEGYNCRILQTNYDNTITIGAGVGEGAAPDAELCENGSELPFYTNEAKPTRDPVPTQFIRQIDTPEPELLPTVCAGNLEIGDTYGWESEIKSVPNCLGFPYCFYKDVIYYTWNNTTWQQTTTTFVQIQDVPEAPYYWETFPAKMPGTVVPVEAFFSGGPRCCELIFTLNGIGGPHVKIAGGDGINVITQDDPPRIVIQRKTTAAADCAQSETNG